MFRYIVIIFLLGILMDIPVGFAQNNAFHRLDVGIATAYSISENSFTRSWNPAPGIQLGILTPFYAGSVEGGIRYTRFNNSPEFPAYADFHSAFIHLGWGYLFDIASKFRAGPVLRFGTTFLLYDDAKTYTRPNAFTYDFDTEESEFTYELLLRNEYRLSQKWKLHAELAYNRTLTYYPLQQTFITFGITWSFDSPSWFQKVFK